MIQVLTFIIDLAVDGATKELVSEVSKTPGRLLTGFHSPVKGKTGLEKDIRQAIIRGVLEGTKTAASKSNLDILNRLEFDYTLREGGIDEYSILSVQPILSSANQNHTFFAQGSYGNYEDRDTVNVGFAYRYITPDDLHMFGMNTFLDHQWPYHHNRMSIGFDYKTSLIGAHLNHYIGLSDWRKRNDGYEERALTGTDIELSGRLGQMPEVELFVRGFYWDQEPDPVLTPKGDDIWGYEMSAEYTPINMITIRGAILKDNQMDGIDGALTLRLNYDLGMGYNELFRRPSYNLNSVSERRYEKVRRQNKIRVQVRQDPDITAQVIFSQGANVSIGQVISFGTLIYTGNTAGDSVTVLFGNGAILDIGQNTRVQIDSDLITLISGIIQYVSADGGITNLAVPNGTIALLGTDVDLRVAGGTTTLRVRDGAANFTDNTGTTRVEKEELAEAQDGDGTPPTIRAENSAVFQAHAAEVHEQLHLIGPDPDNPKAAPYVASDVTVTGTLATGNTLTFTVPLTDPVSVIGSPQL